MLEVCLLTAGRYADIADKQGKKAYDHAFENGHQDIVTYRLTRGFAEMEQKLDYRSSDPDYDDWQKSNTDYIKAQLSKMPGTKP